MHVYPSTIVARLFPVVASITALSLPEGAASRTSAAEESQCVVCHEGIEPIREEASRMMEEILKLGESMGDA